MDDMVKYGYDFSEEDQVKLAAEVIGGSEIGHAAVTEQGKRNQDDKNADTTSDNQ